MFISLMTACSEDPTQLLVVVDSDLLIPTELTDVKAEVEPKPGSFSLRVISN